MPGHLQDAGLTVKAGKCQVGMAEVSYLGHKMGGGCLKPELAKVGAIRHRPAPQTKKQAQAFIGMGGPTGGLCPTLSVCQLPLLSYVRRVSQTSWSGPGSARGLSAC